MLLVGPTSTGHKAHRQLHHQNHRLDFGSASFHPVNTTDNIRERRVYLFNFFILRVPQWLLPLVLEIPIDIFKCSISRLISISPVRILISQMHQLLIRSDWVWFLWYNSLSPLVTFHNSFINNTYWHLHAYLVLIWVKRPWCCLSNLTDRYMIN